MQKGKNTIALCSELILVVHINKLSLYAKYCPKCFIFIKTFISASNPLRIDNIISYYVLESYT
jgi:hypothetical protein